MRDWIRAARPLAHVNIVVPLVLGHAAAWHQTGRIDGRWVGASLLWGVLDHLFVIFGNDFADREADTGARTLLSGGSGVIQEGRLRPTQIANAARVAALALMIYSCGLALLGRGWTPLYALAALLLLWLYSFAPVRASYRGGGELLQGIGMGVGLPSLAYYFQTEMILAPGWVLGPAALLGVCSNVLTGLPDAAADARADKRTVAVRFGVAPARRFASAGIAFSALAVFTYTPGISLVAKATLATLPLFPLLVGARSRDPYRAAWWSSIALNLLLAGWIAGLFLET